MVFGLFSAILRHFPTRREVILRPSCNKWEVILIPVYSFIAFKIPSRIYIEHKITLLLIDRKKP